MVKKNVFNFKLYVEGLKQLKIIGILAFVIYMLEVILIPVSRIISINDMIKYGNANSLVAEITYGINMHPLLVLSFIIVAPVLSLSLFNFLNKRNTSDFYHSLPHTRICIFISFFAAIVTWLFIIVCLTSVFSLLFHMIFSKYFAVVFTSWLMLTLNCFTASLLVSASVAIAMTLTGTFFTNLVVSGLIIFLPRFLSMNITNVMNYALPLVPRFGSAFLIENKYNIVTTYVFRFLNYGYGAEDVLTSKSALIYTLVLAVIYIAIGCFLFNKRKSESASHSAPNRVLQAIYRIALTMVVCIPIIGGIFENRIYNYDQTFTFVICYIFIAVLYFSYELITTRKWKNLWRAIPGLGIVAILNIGIYFGMIGLYNSSLAFTPSANEIDYVSLVSDSADYRYRTLDYIDFVNFCNSNIKIDDSEVKTLIAENLRNNVNAYKKAGSPYRDSFYKELGFKSDDYAKEVDYRDLKCIIVTNNKKHYRNIYVSGADYEMIYKSFEESADYKRMLTNLPKANKNTLYLSGVSKEISPDKLNEIYEQLSKEVEDIDYDKWRDKLLRRDQYDAMIYYSTNIGADSYKIGIPIYGDIMPNTHKILFDEIYKVNKEDRDNVLEFLKDDNIEGDIESFLNITIKETGDNNYIECHDFYYYASTMQELKNINKFLEEYAVDRPISANDSIVYVGVENFNKPYNGSSGGYFRALFNLGDLTLDDLKNTEYENLFTVILNE